MGTSPETVWGRSLYPRGRDSATKQEISILLNTQIFSPQLSGELVT